MDSTITKKIGEALAFGHETNTIIEMEWDIMTRILGDDLTEIQRRNNHHIEAIEGIARTSNSLEAVRSEAAATKEKLDEMRDAYLTRGPDWADATRTFEWLGFFEGAALVVWKYLLGAAEGVHYEELRKLAVDALTFHETLLLSVGSEEAAAGTRQGTMAYENAMGYA